MVGGRGDIRGGAFTREERDILERALREGQVAVPVTEEDSLRLMESLFQRGYVNRHDEPNGGEQRVFVPSSTVASALKQDARRNS